MDIFQNFVLQNSFHYPNFAFVFLLFTYLVQVTIIIGFIISIIKYGRAVLSFFLKDYVFTLLLVLLIVVLSRVAVTFFNSSHIQVLPEKIFAMNMVGRDWFEGVIQPATRLWQGLPIDPKLVYGRGLITFVGILFYPLYKIGACTPDTMIQCSQISYVIVLTLLIASYVSLICFYFKPSVRNILLVSFIAFILGYGGSLGIDRGNIDVLFSLILLILYLLRKHNPKTSWLHMVIETCILGVLCSSKLTMVPLALAFVLTSQYIASSMVFFVLWFIFWSLSPTAFGLHVSLLDSYVAAATWNKKPLTIGCSSGYVFSGIIPLFIPCSIAAKNILSKLLQMRVYIAYGILSAFVFVFPLISLVSKLPVKNKKISSYLSLYYKNRKLFLLSLFTIAVAAINLLPNFSYSYRLYYSLPVLFIAWHSVTTTRSKDLLLFSTMCLLLNGVWFTDMQIVNVLVAVHYLCLIGAVLINLADKLRTKRSGYATK